MAALTLLVLRHAKSDWSSPGLTDHARPLNARGEREAPVTGARLLAAGHVPTLVLCSDAERTRQTWEKMAPLFPHAEASFHRELYLADLEAVAKIVPAFASANHRVVMVVGHNPGFQEMVLALTGRPLEMKTAHCAVITGEASDYRTFLARRDLVLTDVIAPADEASGS